MNWVAVDLGTSTIKASVLDKGNKPVRLSYSMGGYETTLFSSEVAVTEDGKVVIGNYGSLYGMNNPNMKVYEWLHSPNKRLIAKSIFETIKQATAEHYSDSNIGVVLLYYDVLDVELKSIAETVFSGVKTISVGDAIKQIISPNSDMILIADIGESAFRVIIQDKSECVYQVSNKFLGFSSFDMLSLIDNSDISSHGGIEIALLGQIMQHIKILTNNGEKIILPNNFTIKEDSLIESFTQKMTTFLYKCFEECSNALNGIYRSWNDIDEIVFIGGGACSIILNSAFDKYMQSHCSVKSYNSQNCEFDVLFAASHCAIQILELQSWKDVIVTRERNFI